MCILCFNNIKIKMTPKLNQLIKLCIFFIKKTNKNVIIRDDDSIKQ